MSAAESLRVACAIAQVPGYSPSGTARGMLSLFGKSLLDLPSMDSGSLQQAFGWNGSQLNGFRGDCDQPIGRFQRLVTRGIRASTLMDEAPNSWQNRLTNLPMMFYRGDLSLLSTPSIGFSGPRDATSEALNVASRIASAAARNEMTVLSGGARGVDIAAHTAALESGGTTVVIVPQGLDTWFVPPQFLDFRDRMLVASFDLPWAEWTTPSAMQRNRAIVDLSSIITIPQAGTSGGSHKNGLYALGRDRILWVADLGDEYPGNQLLLKRGAIPIPWNDGEPDLDQMRTARSSKLSQKLFF